MIFIFLLFTILAQSLLAADYTVMLYGGYYPQEISWSLVKVTGLGLGETTQIVAISSDYVSEWTPTLVELEAGNATHPVSYIMNMTDTWGDGWNNVTFEIFDTTTLNVISSGTLSSGLSGQSPKFSICSIDICDYISDAGSVVNGCMDADATNYDPAATSDDGNCQYASTVSIDVSGGLYPEEISWDVTNSSGAVIASGVGVAGNDQTLPLDYGMYSMNMYDSWGDGWNGNTYTITGVTGVTGAGAVSVTGGLTGLTSSGTDIFCVGTCPGCMDTTADNYNSAAHTDDVSCTYTGCTNPDATNFDPLADTDDDSCCFSELVTLNLYDLPWSDGWGSYYGNPDGKLTIDTVDYLLPSGGTVAYNICIDLTECTDVIYTAPDLWADENSWNVTDSSGAVIGSGGDWVSSVWDASGTVGTCIVNGCTDPTATNYNAAANTDDGSCIAPVNGCTDPTAVNYHPPATVDDGSCFGVNGCTDATATNYNAAAYTDDGSCIYPCLLDEVTLNLYDSWGDGWNGGTLIIGEPHGDSVLYTISPWGDTESFDICIDLTVCTDVIYTAGSYQSENSWDVTDSSGAVIVSGGNNNGQFGSTCGVNGYVNCPDVSVTLNLHDSYGDGWGSASYYSPDGKLTIDTVDYLLPDGGTVAYNICIDLTECTDVIYTAPDLWADENSWNVTDSSGAVIGSGGDWVSGVWDASGTVGTCGVYGCTDATAPNYDAAADTDDGSCCEDTYATLNLYDLPWSDGWGSIYSWNPDGKLTINGIDYTTSGGTVAYNICIDLDVCTDVSYTAPDWYSAENSWDIKDGTDTIASGGDWVSGVWDASGTVGECIVNGCTDATALNYDAAALLDDGSCIAPVYGCTDPTALNYYESANTDDGICIAGVGGCMDVLATNYNVAANTDDGSCCYGTDVSVTLTLTDSWGDGWGNGYLTIDGVVYTQILPYTFSLVQTEEYESFNICIDLTVCTDVIYTADVWYSENSWGVDIGGVVINNGVGDNPAPPSLVGACGCIDPLAHNYNAAATPVDGGCTYASIADMVIVNGCTDVLANNYNVAATTDDGSCCSGTDVSATLKLYNSYGDGWNGGSLTIDGVVYTQSSSNPGADEAEAFNICIDLTACTDVSYTAGLYAYENSWDVTNSSGAVINNGVGTYSYITHHVGACVPGCIYTTADNFDQEAHTDDGSCTYTCNSTLSTATLTLKDTTGYGCGGLHVPSAMGQTTLTVNTGANASFTICYNPINCNTIDFISGQQDEGCVWQLTNDDGEITSADGHFGICVPGCMDHLATHNYNPAATTDDGSCIYASQCMDAAATNFNPEATIDDGSCCNEPYVSVTLKLYNSWGDGWNGDYLTIDGVNYNQSSPNPGAGEAESSFLCIDLTACTDVSYTAGSGSGYGLSSDNSWSVFNRNGAVINNGVGGGNNNGHFGASCVPGCMDPLANNSNTAAQIDDGSCLYNLHCPGTTLVKLNLYDSYGDGWNGNVINIGTGANVISSGQHFLSGSNNSTLLCIESCDLFEFKPIGNYPSECSWKITFPNTIINDVHGNHDTGLSGPYGDCVPGCTDANATNYNAEAKKDDGSCVIDGCMTFGYPNYNPKATVTVSTACSCNDGETAYTLTLKDSWGDGWNGNTLTIDDKSYSIGTNDGFVGVIGTNDGFVGVMQSNGVMEYDLLSSGDTASFGICVASCNAVTAEVTAEFSYGDWSNECSWEIVTLDDVATSVVATEVQYYPQNSQCILCC